MSFKSPEPTTRLKPEVMGCKIETLLGYALLTVLAAGALLPVLGCSDRSTLPKAETEQTLSVAPSGMNVTWVEKYQTFEQNEKGELHQTDNIFLAEVGYTDAEAAKNHTAEVYVFRTDVPLVSYGSGDLFSYTNGFIYSRKTKSFDTLQDLEAEHPESETYVWKITGPDGVVELRPMRIGGPEGRTEIPALTRISLAQDGEPVATLSQIDPGMDITFSWNKFREGAPAPLEGSDFDDLHFFLVDNCHGEFVYTGGAPGGEKNVVTDYTVTSATMPAAALEPGMDYTAFLSRVNFRDFDRHGIIMQLTANSFAVELPFRTSGEISADRLCPNPHWRADYRFSRKSPKDAGMVAWPTVQEIADRAGGVDRD